MPIIFKAIFTLSLLSYFLAFWDTKYDNYFFGAAFGFGFLGIIIAWMYL